MGALEGCDLVVHLAGRTRASSLTDFLTANAEVSQRLAETARQTGSRLVYISSQAAAGTGTPERPTTEEDTPSPISDYGRSKLAGEEAVRGVEGLDFTSLRPSAVYGPGDRDFLTLLRCAERGFFPTLGRAGAAYSFLYIDDLVEAIEIVAERGELSGQIFFVAHPRPSSLDDFSSALAAAFDRPLRSIPVPTGLLWLASSIGVLAAKLGFDPLMTPSRYREITAEGFVCSTDKLATATEFRAGVPLEEGLRRTIDWYTRNRLAGGDS